MSRKAHVRFWRQAGEGDFPRLASSRVKVLYPDSTMVTYSFNQGSRLASLSDWASRTTSYQYWPDGKLHTATNVNTTTAGYSYDNAQRLTQV